MIVMSPSESSNLEKVGVANSELKPIAHRATTPLFGVANQMLDGKPRATWNWQQLCF